MKEEKIYAKIIIIGVIIVALLIPLFLIQALIHERSNRYGGVQLEVSASFGLQQQLRGPVLDIPYKTYIQYENGKSYATTTRAYFLPDVLEIDCEVYPEIRYRSIYTVILYKTKLRIRGRFAEPDFSLWKVNDSDILRDEASFSFGIPDMRGIKKEVELLFNDEKLTFQPGIQNVNFLASGMTARIPVLHQSKDGKGYNFDFELQLTGSGKLSFAPFGKETTVNIRSTWPNPSFQGSFLPTERVIGPDGFKATWEISHFGRSYPSQWRVQDLNNYTSAIIQSDFGVTLLNPVDFYQKSTRSVKYGILFLALTFLIFFLFEVLRMKRIHPVQYLMIGFANCLFYLLLLSLSEHAGFMVSYLVATIATIGLIGAYTKTIMTSKSELFMIVGIYTLLYGYLYILLQIQDYALIAGTTGIFIIMTTVMYITRGIDWYSHDIQQQKT